MVNPIEKRKGIGYMIEAFIASLTIFIFAAGSITSPPGTDWNKFQTEVTAKDLSYVLETSGHLKNFSIRAETGSLETSISTLTEGEFEVSGSIENLPVGEKTIGFYTLPPDSYEGLPTEDVDSGNLCNGDLEEINSEYVIKTNTSSIPANHGVNIYLADTDPEIPDGFNGKQDYDTLWVDNGSTCQFSDQEGPYRIEEFFKWGDSANAQPDNNYDLKSLTKDGNFYTVYKADQVVRFRNTMKKSVNGIPTNINFDTFNFTVEDLNIYDGIIFREDESLSHINSHQSRVISYVKTNPILLLADLTSSDLNSGFLDRTGLKWIDLSFSSSPSGVKFPDNRMSNKIKTYFKGQDGEKTQTTPDIGGKISSKNADLTLNSGEKMVVAAGMKYVRDEWNSTNMSMEKIPSSEAPSGMPSDYCSSEIYRGNFTFPSGEIYSAWSVDLGECNNDPWATSIDLNENGEIENGEGPFLEGENITAENRRYTIKFYSKSEKSICRTGNCTEFVYYGKEEVETINFRKEFEDEDIYRFARSGYETNYNQDDRKLLSSVIYWMTGSSNKFGEGEVSGIKTSVIGSVKNQVYMPYRVNLRWSR